MTRRRRPSEPAPLHPLTNEWWLTNFGAGDPTDNARCLDCGGFLSFEWHDMWHDMHAWNRDRFADAKAKAREDFDKSHVTKLRQHAAGKPAPNGGASMI